MTQRPIKTNQPELEDAACFLCKATVYRSLISSGDLHFGTSKGIVYQVVSCNSCGAVYTTPRPTEASIHLVYPAHYYTIYPNPAAQKRWHQLAHSLFTHTWEGHKVRVLNTLLAHKLSKPIQLLDVGCGRAGFLIVANKRFKHIELTGTDFTLDAAKIALPHVTSPGEIRLKTFSELDPEDKYDVITMWHVLEHVHDPISFLRKWMKHLKPGGSIVLEVPQLDTPIRKLMGAWWPPYDLPRHLVHFSQQTLSQCADKAGLTVKSWHYPSQSWLGFASHAVFGCNFLQFNHWLYPMMAGILDITSRPFYSLLAYFGKSDHLAARLECK